MKQKNDSPKILLFTRQPELMHGELLRSQGFQVDVVRTLAEASSLIQSRRYQLALLTVNENSKDALEFCEESKKTAPQTLVALLRSGRVHIPKSECPDDVLETDFNPAKFIRQVNDLVAP
ncbi:MAG: hypothetical protein JWO13_2535 [Acidobacteriales bacterium]|nr:hypothetical protein [Terriglobales bacterium]